jgi:hypothetical protein
MTYAYAVEAAIRFRRALAYHESGHSVSAMHMGLGVDFATIVPDGARLGRVRHDPAKNADDEISILLAGTLAQLKAYPNAPVDNGGDMDRIERAAARAWGRYSSQHLDRLTASTRALVDRHWQAITAVADALYTRATLTGAEIAAMIEQTERPQAPPKSAASQAAPGVGFSFRERRGRPPFQSGEAPYASPPSERELAAAQAILRQTDTPSAAGSSRGLYRG